MNLGKQSVLGDRAQAVAGVGASFCHGASHEMVREDKCNRPRE